MKLLGQDSYFCDNCREWVIETFYVKFPAMNFNQEQEFCRQCADKFSAWKRHEISVQDLFNKDFKLEDR